MDFHDSELAALADLAHDLDATMGGFPYVPPSSNPPDFVHQQNRQAAGANTLAASLLVATPGRTWYLIGYILWIGAAAAGGTVTATISGLSVTSNLDLTWGTTAGDRIVTMFGQPVPASGPNIAINTNIPATGAAGPACGIDVFAYLI